MSTLKEYYDDYNKFGNIYWDIEELNFSFLKWASTKFTNIEIKEFLDSIYEWDRHCLTEKKDENWLYNYRGFNIHFYYFKPLKKHSHGYFYDKSHDAHFMPYMYNLCIVTFTKDQEINDWRNEEKFIQS